MANQNHQVLFNLRSRTGAGVLDCKNALEEARGDIEKATEILRKKGKASAAGKSTRQTREGLVYAYIHAGGRIGALVEVNCETDFVARTAEFQQLAKEIALQIVGASPRWVRREDVPKEVVDKEREIYVQQAQTQAGKKPVGVIEKMMEGRLNKFFEETCLLDQSSIRDPSGKTKVSDLIQQAIAKLGENMTVRRIARFQLGEE